MQHIISFRANLTGTFFVVTRADFLFPSCKSYHYPLLVGGIRNAVALWTEDGWERLCNLEPGFVYVLSEDTSLDDNESGRGWLYRIS